jgi:hypothetical protein
MRASSLARFTPKGVATPNGAELSRSDEGEKQVTTGTQPLSLKGLFYTVKSLLPLELAAITLRGTKHGKECR